jgi:hypothetical protein
MVRFILALGERSKLIDLVGYTERVKLALQTGSEYRVRSLSGAAAGSSPVEGHRDDRYGGRKIYHHLAHLHFVTVYSGAGLSDLGKVLYKLIQYGKFWIEQKTPFMHDSRGDRRGPHEAA